MAISPDDKQHLLYIADAIDEINGYVAFEKYEDFVQDEFAKEAVTRQFQNVGGAAKLLTDDFKMAYGDVDWDVLINLENAMYSQAEETEYHGIWSILKEDFPIIRTQVMDLAVQLSDLEDIEGSTML